MVTLNHASFLEEAGTLAGTAIFGEEFKEVEDKVVKAKDLAEKFYENHKTFFEGVELLALAGTGLGEAGMFAEIGELYTSGAFNVMYEGAVELMPGDMVELKSTVNGMFTALNSLKSLVSKDAVVGIGEASIDIISPWLEKFISGQVLRRYPFTAAQLVILFGNLIGTTNINTPEVACKMQNVLYEYKKLVVNARLEKLVAPNDFDRAVEFYEGKIKAQNKKYNKTGYLTHNGLRCRPGDVCFTDKFKRGTNKQICNKETWPVCYEDYAGVVRHQTEAAFPTQIFKTVCHKNKFLEDQTDGNFIILQMLIKFITKKIY